MGLLETILRMVYLIRMVQQRMAILVCLVSAQLHTTILRMDYMSWYIQVVLWTIFLLLYLLQLRWVVEKCFVIFGKVVIKNTRWLFEDALTLKNARIERLDLPELDRTRDGTEDRSLVDRATDDDINEYTCCERYSLLHQLLPERDKSWWKHRERTGWGRFE